MCREDICCKFADNDFAGECRWPGKGREEKRLV